MSYVVGFDFGAPSSSVNANSCNSNRPSGPTNGNVHVGRVGLNKFFRFRVLNDLKKVFEHLWFDRATLQLFEKRANIVFALLERFDLVASTGSWF